MKKRQNIAELIQKYLENKCTKEELDDILKIISEDKYKEQIEFLLYEYWNSKPLFNEKLDIVELDELQDSINRKINQDSNKEDPGILKQLYYYARNTAAALFIPLFIGTGWLLWKKDIINNHNSMVTMETPAGSKLKTTLPDGTIVWQNNSTILKYPATFSKKNRNVELTGEAYFHVSADKKNPFYVKTIKGNIKVTGTRFNVCSFPDDEFSSIVLEEGEVAFQPNDQEPLIYLEPATQLIINNKSGRIDKQHTDVEKNISWIDGKLIFRNEPLAEVVKKLRRWYDTAIIINDPTGKVSKHPLTMTIKNEHLHQVLKNIIQAADLKLEEKNISSSNTQEKQFIISGN